MNAIEILPKLDYIIEMLNELKGTPLECLIFDIETIMCEVEDLKDSVEEALKEATNED